jgi:alpha-1,4-digalacturonate transport system permease protein
VEQLSLQESRFSESLFAVLTSPLALVEGFFNLLQRALGIQRMGYVFILPNLIIFGVFIILPMLLNFYFGFTSGRSILPENRAVVGTQNLETLLTCEDYQKVITCQEDLFWRGARNTVIYVAVEVMALISISLLTALALNRQIKGRAFFRSVFFYPVLLSPVVVALIWKWVLQHQYGLLNSVMTELGQDRIPFLLQPRWATFWVITISVWAHMGFYTLILLAGLQAIPQELYEAAAMDGASEWRRLLNITIPLLRPTLSVVIVLSLIRAVQVFDIAYVLTGGGPGTATQYLVQYIYQTAFDDQRYGIAAAASLLMALALLVLTSFQGLLGRRISREEA